MAQIPTIESDVQRVIRIAKVLDISIEDAAVTCDAFHLAFSDDRMRRAIFEIVDELDRSADKQGELLGLIINYTVELGMDGIRVGRYADEIPAGEVVELTPPHRASILLRIVNDFPTQEFLGPLIVNRPGWHFDTFDPDSSDLEMSADLSQCGVTRAVICLGPIRLKFAERFPFISPATSSSKRPPLQAGNHAFHSKARKPHHYLLPWAALSVGMPAFRSGLSPPHPSENLGPSERKMFLRQ